MNQTVAQFIAEKFYWVFLGVLALNVFTRKYGRRAMKKRTAILFLAIIIFGLYVSGVLIVQFELYDYLLIGYAALAGGVMYFFRKQILPFRIKCRECGATMELKEIVFEDSNMCEKCRERLQAKEESN